MKSFRGIFTIPATPFLEDTLEVDYDGLREVVEFCVAAGGHGIVVPVNASEYSSLSDDERRKVLETAVRQVNGRIPVVAGVSGVTTHAAVEFARHAQGVGADAMIAMSPYIFHGSNEEIFEYYAAINEVSDVPIFIQNYMPPLVPTLSVEFMYRLTTELKNVMYIKEESQWSQRLVKEIRDRFRDLSSNVFGGVMSGKGGRHLIDDYKKGVCGNMPACQMTDLHARIWNYLDAGEEEKAIELYNRVLPLMIYETGYGIACYKTALKERGVIKSAVLRQHGGIRELDADDLRELRRLIDSLRPEFTV